MDADKATIPNLAPKQFGRNLAVNIASLVISLLTGFFLAPFLVRRLGVEGYGLIPLISGLVSYLSVANIALNSAVVRHLSVAVAQRDHVRANRLFSTSFWGSLGVSTVVLLLGGLASVHAPALINVPIGLEQDARVLFLTTTGSVAFVLVASPLSVALYYTNRLDKKGLIDLGNRVIYVLLVFSLVALVSPRPAWVGLALLASSAMGLAQTASARRHLMPWLRVQAVFSWSIFQEMIWFGGWSLVIYAGNLVFLSADLIVVNRFVGPAAGGLYAAIFQWPGLVRAFAATTASVFSQPMAYLFARDGRRVLAQYSLGAVRKTAFVVLVAVTAIGGSAEPLLRLWLGPSIGAHWPLLLLFMIHLGPNLATSPLISALQTLLRVRALGIATIIAGALDVAGSVLLLKLTDLGVWAVAIAGAVALSGLASVFVPIFAAREFGCPAREPLAIVGKTALLGAGGCVLGSAVATAMTIRHWWALAIHAGVLAMAAGAAAFFVVLDQGTQRAALTVLRGQVTAARARLANLTSRE